MHIINDIMHISICEYIAKLLSLRSAGFCYYFRGCLTLWHAFDVTFIIVWNNFSELHMKPSALLCWPLNFINLYFVQN